MKQLTYNPFPVTTCEFWETGNGSAARQKEEQQHSTLEGRNGGFGKSPASVPESSVHPPLQRTRSAASEGLPGVQWALKT